MSKTTTSVFLVLIFLSQATSLNAHTLNVDGTIGGILHIQPSENPTAGSVSILHLSLEDTTGNFHPTRGECTAAVSFDSTELVSQEICVSNPSANSEDLQLEFTFPQPGLYSFTVTGKPQDTGSFSEFFLSYDIQVNPPPTSSPPLFKLTLFGYVFSLMLLILIFLWLRRSFSNQD